MKREQYLKFKINKKILAYSIKVTAFIGVLILIAVILMKVLVPIVFSILTLFIALLKLYILLDTTSKFFGGFILLFILYKILSFIILIWIDLFQFAEKLLKNIQKDLKKNRKNKK